MMGAGRSACCSRPDSSAFSVCVSRQTKPLSFADCIGDELPVGWEEAYDPVIGPYYVDHNTSEFCCGSGLLSRSPPLTCAPPAESTQLEDPRVQWQREQEAMLRDYLSVARDALSTQREICQVKEQRLQLAQQEYLQLNEAWRDKSSSQTSRESDSSARRSSIRGALA